MLTTSFWAVPDFRRVEPEMNSGPTTVSIAMSAMRPMAEFALAARAIVRAPRACAISSAPHT